jgi:hypothetical protein
MKAKVVSVEDKQKKDGGIYYSLRLDIEGKTKFVSWFEEYRPQENEIIEIDLEKGKEYVSKKDGKTYNYWTAYPARWVLKARIKELEGLLNNKSPSITDKVRSAGLVDEQPDDDIQF